MRHRSKIYSIIVFLAIGAILFGALNAAGQGPSQLQHPKRFQSQIQNKSGESLLGENILGMQVKTKSGKDVGDIQDVLFNRSGKVQDFIVDTNGGFFGMGGKTIAIPKSDLNYDTTKGYAVYQGSEADIKKMPNINYEPHAYGYGPYPYRPYWGRPYWGGYYGRPYWGGGYYGYGQSSRGYYGARPPEVSMRGVIGAQVLTEGGNNVGDIKNLIVNRKGQVTAAIIDVGGFLGIGTKKVAIPYNQLQNVGPYYVMYPGTERQLKNMPTFNPSQFQQNRGG